MSDVREVYADGGCVRVNPSPHGGTWAWCHVNAAGERVAGASGTVRPADTGFPVVSNNQTEFLALLLCLEALPDGWAGRAFTDSGVTLTRFSHPNTAKTNGLPPAWVGRMRVTMDRLGEVEFVLLGGHPSKKELAAGVRKDGKPVSIFNVWCDEQCQRQGADFSAALDHPSPAPGEILEA